MKEILRITYLTETWSYKFMRNTYRHGNPNLDFISTMRGRIRVPMSVQSQDFADDIHVLREIQQQQNSKLWTQITQLFKNFVSKIFQLCNSFFKKLTKTIQNDNLNSEDLKNRTKFTPNYSVGFTYTVRKYRHLESRSLFHREIIWIQWKTEVNFI